MRRLNLRLLLILVLGLVLGGALIQGLHAFQVRRHSNAFLHQADRAELSGEPQEAADFLRKYLLLSPDDTQAMGRLGNLLYDQRRFYESQGILNQLVQRDPNNDDARRRLADISIRVRRYQDAQYQLHEFLLKSHPDDADLYLQLGTCQQGLNLYVPSAASFAVAIAKNPALIAAYDRLARLLSDRPQILTDRTLPILIGDLQGGDSSKVCKSQLGPLQDSPSAAMKLLNVMVARNPKSSDAYIVRGRFRQAHASEPLVRATDLGPKQTSDSNPTRAMLERSFADAKQGLALAPSDLNAILFAAETALASGSHKEARKFAEQAIESSPAHPQSYLVLASLDLLEKRPKDAVDLLNRGIKASRGAPVLLWTLANLLIERHELQEARQLIEQLKAFEDARPIAQYLSARLLVADSSWVEASRQIEGVSGDLKRWPQLARDSQFWLGQCYSQLGRDDLAVGANRAALEIDPTWSPARFSLAESLRRQGHLEESMSEIGKLRQLPDAQPQLSVTWLRLAILQNLSKPKNERDWTAIDAELKKLMKDQTAAEPILLAAEVEVARSGMEKGSALLANARAAHPDNPLLWTASVDLASRRKSWSECERQLQEMRGRLGDVATYRLAKAEYLVRRFGGSGEKEMESLKRDLKAIADPPAKSSKTDRQNLTLGLAQAAFEIRDFEQAERLWRAAAQSDPQDIQIRLRLFDLAAQSLKPEVMKVALEEVGKMEGNGPIFHYGEALHATIEARQSQNEVERNNGNNGDAKGKVDKSLEKATAELAEARARWPNWSRIPLLAGEVDVLRKQPKQAMDDWLEAFDFGERRPSFVQRLLMLLFEQNEPARAGAIIRKLQDEKLPFSSELARLASEASARAGDFGQAAEWARKSTAVSKTLGDQILLAQLLQMAGNMKEAESEFKKAIQLADNDPRAWMALIQFYTATNRQELAENSFEQAKIKFPDNSAKSANFRAYAYELIGQKRKAEQEYEAAVQVSTPDDRIRRQWESAAFKIRERNVKEAEVELRKIVSAKDRTKDAQTIALARNTLAVLLASSGVYAKILEAHALIAENPRSSNPSELDRRAAAIVYAAFPTDENRKIAIASLESLANRPGGLALDDRFLLASLYQSDGDWTKASPLFHDVATRSKSPQHLATYVDALMRHNELAQAEDWLKKYDKLEEKWLQEHPDQPREKFALVELHVRLLARQDQYDKAFQQIVRFVEGNSADAKTVAEWRVMAAGRLVDLGDQLTKLKRGDQARSFYDRAEGYLKSPDAARTLPQLDHMRFLVRRRRYDDALAEFELFHRKGTDNELAGACLALGSIQSADRGLLQRIERLLSQVTADRPSAPAWVTLASTQDQLGSYDAAEENFRRALAIDGKRVDALNNLAYLLGLRKKKLPEARSLIDRAIAEAGPRSPLLDSRAVIELAQGAAAAAAVDSENAVRDLPTSAHLFHQARIRLANGQRDAARLSFQKALQLGLAPANLHPIEATTFQELRAQLEPIRN